MTENGDTQQSNITVYGKPDCVDFQLVKRVLEAENIDYTFINILTENFAAEAEKISGSVKSPVVVFPDGTFSVEPGEEELRHKLFG